MHGVRLTGGSKWTKGANGYLYTVLLGRRQTFELCHKSHTLNNYSSTAVITILTSLNLNIGLKSFLSTAVSIITAVCCCYSPAESPNFMGMEVCAFKIVTDWIPKRLSGLVWCWFLVEFSMYHLWLVVSPSCVSHENMAFLCLLRLLEVAQKSQHIFKKRCLTSSANRISGLVLFSMDFESRVELSLSRDSDNLSASNWNCIEQSTVSSRLFVNWKLLIFLTALYLFVVVNIVQVYFLCQTQVEKGLPFSLYRISVCLTKTSTIKFN